MIHAFSSPELSELLNLELATGQYSSDEEVLLAGVMALRELRTKEAFDEPFQAQREGVRAGKGSFWPTTWPLQTFSIKSTMK